MQRSSLASVSHNNFEVKTQDHRSEMLKESMIIVTCKGLHSSFSPTVEMARDCMWRTLDHNEPIYSRLLCLSALLKPMQQKGHWKTAKHTDSLLWDLFFHWIISGLLHVDHNLKIQLYYTI